MADDLSCGLGDLEEVAGFVPDGSDEVFDGVVAVLLEVVYFL